MKTLVLAEKPSVAADYARVLGSHAKQKGFFSGERYLVTWALGHLVTLAEPHDYDPRFKEWRLEDLPILPHEMRLKLLRQTSHQFQVVKGLLQRQDVGELIIATDAGREGELVARWILRLAGWKRPFKRLWISSQTDGAIRDGFQKLQPGAHYDSLFRAALCRSEADWLVGLNVTRALTCRYDFSLSAGRVQTPTLALIVEREREIQAFKAKPFWLVKADFGAFFAHWQNNQGGRFFNQAEAEAFAAKLRGKTAQVEAVQRAEKSDPPPLAYDLTALQRDANERFHFSAQKTLAVLQGLYERHKLVTYPRTDSRYITSDMVATLPARLQAIATGPYAAVAKSLLQGKLAPGKRVVDDSKVSDHDAIIPTDASIGKTTLDADEKRIHDLIVRRFLAILLPAMRFEETRVTVRVGGEPFHARSRVTIAPGWRSVSAPSEAEGKSDDELPLQAFRSLERGAALEVRAVVLVAGQTKPPPRYTESTLLAAMESPGKFIADDELRESIKAGGLGTPATRAEIIEKLVDNRYMERHGRELVPLPTGMQLVGIVPEELRSAELTARWEQRLARIAKNQEQSADFMADIRRNAAQLVAEVKAAKAEFKFENKAGQVCPMCGKPMQETKGKKGREMLCVDRRCGYAQSQASADNPLGIKASANERRFNKRLIEQYSDNREKGATLGDILESALKKK